MNCWLTTCDDTEWEVQRAKKWYPSVEVEENSLLELTMKGEKRTANNCRLMKFVLVGNIFGLRGNASGFAAGRFWHPVDTFSAFAATKMQKKIQRLRHFSVEIHREKLLEWIC